jgi:hypothetical protein
MRLFRRLRRTALLKSFLGTETMILAIPSEEPARKQYFKMGVLPQRPPDIRAETAAFP